MDGSYSTTIPNPSNKPKLIALPNGTQFPGAFCYPDGIYEDGHIMFSIEYNRHDILFVDHTLPKEFYM